MEQFREQLKQGLEDIQHQEEETFKEWISQHAYAIPIACQCSCACTHPNTNFSGACDQCLTGVHIYPDNTDSTPIPETSTSQGLTQETPRAVSPLLNSASSSGERTPGSSQSGGMDLGEGHVTSDNPNAPFQVIRRNQKGELEAHGLYAQPTPRNRVRINVSTSTKGVKTWDCTLEIEGATIEEALQESDKLVAELESRYPVKE